MSKEGNKLMRRRLVRAYVSSVISIALVLVLVGVAALLFVNAGSVADYLKESVQLTVILDDDVSDDAAAAFRDEASGFRYVREAVLITREQGKAELEEMLGEDFLDVFETAPVPVSVDMRLKAEYVSSDSLAMVASDLKGRAEVADVTTQTSLVDALNTNVAKITLVLGIFILIFLFVSFVLIGNTVRLDTYSRRFTIHTMQLVGATRGFIRRPFVRRAFVQGLASALLAILALAAALFFLRRSFPQIYDLFCSSGQLPVAAGVVVLAGVAICVVSTFFVVGKILGLNKDELYG